MDRLAGASELLDGPLDADALAGNLRDLARVNRWLGGVAISRRALIRLLAGRPRFDGGAASPSRGVDPCGASDPPTAHGAPIRFLDVGTGGGDIPAALLAWAARRDLELEIDAVDARSEIVEAARRRIGDQPRLRLSVATGQSLPFADGSFDVAHASMVVHHLEPEEAGRLLSEMRRVSRLGVIVNDLDRSRVAWLAAKALFRVVTRNAYTRHDGPLSVLRAYHPAEVTALARAAGLVQVDHAFAPFRHRYALAFAPARVPDESASRPDGR